MSDFARLDRKFTALAGDLSGKGMKRSFERVGRELAPLVDQAVRADIGDLSMSGWSRRNPTPIRGRSTLTGDGLAITPTAAGHMRVLEQGRNQGNAGGMAGPGVSRDGTTARTKSGAVRKTRARRGRRWNGTTKGKDTWSDASAEIGRRAPGMLNAEKVAAMARYFR